MNLDDFIFINSYILNDEGQPYQFIIDEETFAESNIATKTNGFVTLDRQLFCFAQHGCVIGFSAYIIAYAYHNNPAGLIEKCLRVDLAISSVESLDLSFEDMSALQAYAILKKL